MAEKRHKFVRMFPDIINREAFYHRNHPKLDPRTKDYIEYWRKEKKRCIEGFWGQEANKHWRWMPPKLYFYINHWEILLVDEENNSRYYAPPNLDDNEWIIGTYCAAVYGFSGFVEDEKITCNNLVKKREDSLLGRLDEYGRPIKFTAYDERRLAKTKYIHKADGSLKEYMEPFEYLKLSHTKPLGNALWANEPMNGMIFTARSNGKTFTMSSDAGHEYLFGGLKYYDNPLFPAKKKPDGEVIKLPGEVMVGSVDPTKTFSLTEKIQYGLLNLKGEYDDGEVLHPAPFAKKYVGTLKVGDTLRASYDKKIKGQWKKVADGSFIQVVNYGSDLNAGASKRLSKQYVDEVGLLDGADEMHGVSKHSKAGGGVRYGSTMYTGTGGDIEKIDSSKKMFYGAALFDIYTIEDYWENKGRIGLFMPGYYSLRQYKDENGNTIYEDAIAEMLAEREKLSNAADPLLLIQEKMFMPLIPSEMFYNIQDNIFPAGFAVDRINELEEDEMWEKQLSVGYFSFVGEKQNAVVWNEAYSMRKLVIRDLMLDKYADKGGAIAIYEHPNEIELGQDKLYKVTYDPYSIDGKTGESYGSVLVYKGIPRGDSRHRMYDTIVGEYVGRKLTVEEVHEIAIQMAMYFNTKVLAEVNTQGFKQWAINKKYYHLLQEEPFEAIYADRRRHLKQYKVGVNMTGPLKQHCLQLLKTWFLEARQRDDDGKVVRYNMHEIWSTRLLHEVINFGDGNFDHISSALLMALWIDQDGKQTVESKSEEKADDFEKFFLGRKSSLYNPLLS